VICRRQNKRFRVPHQTFKSCLWPTCRQIICSVSDCLIKYTCESFNSVAGRSASHIRTLWKIARHKTGLNILVNKQHSIVQQIPRTHTHWWYRIKQLVLSIRYFSQQKAAYLSVFQNNVHWSVFGSPAAFQSFKAVREKRICAKLRTG